MRILVLRSVEEDRLRVEALALRVEDVEAEHAAVVVEIAHFEVVVALGERLLADHLVGLSLIHI